jgi:hypothetical protein
VIKIQRAILLQVMMPFPTTTGPLEAFLQQPNIEASPAWEFINDRAQQKPMPTLFHSGPAHRLC